MEIDTLEGVQLGGITQRIRVRGADSSNPALLLMQQGPGLPIINDARRLERLLGLEKAFTVIYWDQRGTGLSSPSLRKDPSRFEISVTRMVDDTVTLLELLRDRFGGKHPSPGSPSATFFAAYAAAQRPAGGRIGSGGHGHRHAPSPGQRLRLRARRRPPARQPARNPAAGSHRPAPAHNLKQFTTRARWVANFGGVATNAKFNSLLRALLLSLVRSPDYSAADIIRTVRGISASQAALLPQLATTDLVRTVPCLDVPLVMAQGRLDQVAPGEAAQRFHDF